MSHVRRCQTSVSPGYVKPSGITPTIVYAGPFSATALPMMPGSRVEPIAPEPMTDDRDGVARIERVGRESGSEHGTDADDLEEVAAGLNRIDPQRIVSGFGQVELRIPPRRRIVEHLREVAIVAEVHRRNPLVREALGVVRFPDHREPIRV